MEIARSVPSQNCGFDGNDDIYGLGIRLGIYAQTIAVWLGGDLIPQNTRELVTINSLFVFSMLVSLVISSAKNSIHAVEAFIILSMVLATYFTGPILRHRSKILFNKGLESQLTTLMLDIFIGCYANWFWWRGLDRLPPTPCGTFGFVLFYRFDLYGPIRTVCKITSIFYMCRKIPIFIRKGLEVCFLSLSSRSNPDVLHSSLHQEADSATRELTAKQHDDCEEAYEEVPKLDILQQPPKIVENSRQTGSWSESFSTPADLAVMKMKSRPACNDQKDDLYPVGVSRKEFPTLTTVFAADKFLTRIYEGYTTQMADLHWIGFTIRGLPFYITPVRPLLAVYVEAIGAFAKCLLKSPKRLPPILIVRLLFVIEPWIPSGHENTVLVREVLNHPSSKEFTFEDLHLAARVRASRFAPKRPIWVVLRTSAIGLFFCAILILTAELTIRWNHIRIGQNLTSVGQIVPLLIGCGSLFRVLYMEAKHWFVNGTGSIASKKQTQPENRVWAEAYYVWKEHYQNSKNNSSNT